MNVCTTLSTSIKYITEKIRSRGPVFFDKHNDAVTYYDEDDDNEDGVMLKTNLEIHVTFSHYNATGIDTQRIIVTIVNMQTTMTKRLTVTTANPIQF